MAVSSRYKIVAGLVLGLLAYGSQMSAKGVCCTGAGGPGSPPPVVSEPPATHPGTGVGCCGVAPRPSVNGPGDGGNFGGPNLSVIGPQIGGVNVSVNGPSVNGPSISVTGPNINTNQTTIVNGYTGGVVTSGGGVSYFIGGGASYGGGGVGGHNGSVISGLNVEDSAARTTSIADMTSEDAAIQALCIDDQNMPHPASRTNGDITVPANFSGELFRCMAGTRMQVSVGHFKNNKPDLSNAKTFACAKGEALLVKGTELRCATQIQERSCHERSLLRRFGPGIKRMALVRQDTVINTRTESSSLVVSKTDLATDGGVGSLLY